MNVDIIGRRGLGKTTLALYLSRTSERVIALDPRNHLPVGDGGVIYDPSSSEAPDFVSVISQTTGRIVVRPSGNLQDAVDTLAGDVRDLLARFPLLHVTIILDEAGTFTLDEWNYLFRTADRDRVWFILTCHRPVDIEPWARTLADWIIAFRTTEPNDLKLLRERCSEAFAESARRLAPQQWILWDDTTSSERDQTKFYMNPTTWFVPLDRSTTTAPPQPSRLPSASDRPTDTRDPSLF